MTELEAPTLGQLECIEQSKEQRDVAESQAKVLEPYRAYRVSCEQHDLGIGALAILRAEALDAGLAKLTRMRLVAPVGKEAERRPIIAIAGFFFGVGMALEIEPRHRDG